MMKPCSHPYKPHYRHTRIAGVSFKRHRVAYCEAHGIPLSDIDGLVVRHGCDNPQCEEPTHLSIGTQKDNMQDMVSRGRSRSRSGEAHCMAKLTWEIVRAIRREYVRGSRTSGGPALARKYGTDQTNVSLIVAHKIWRELNDGAGHPVGVRNFV